MTYFLGIQSRKIQFLGTLIKKILLYARIHALNTIKGGSRRAEKSRKALMLMMSARLWWTRAVRNGESKIVFMLAA